MTLCAYSFLAVVYLLCVFLPLHQILQQLQVGADFDVAQDLDCCAWRVWFVSRRIPPGTFNASLAHARYHGHIVLEALSRRILGANAAAHGDGNAVCDLGDSLGGEHLWDIPTLRKSRLPPWIVNEQRCDSWVVYCAVCGHRRR